MTESPLLSCLIWLTKHFGVPGSAESILYGLPATAITFDISLLERAAHNANLEVYEKKLNEVRFDDQCPCPCLVFYHSKPLLITGVSGSIITTIRPYDAPKEEVLELSELLINTENVVYFFSLKSMSESCSGDEGQEPEDHWFWGALLSCWRIYREVLLVSLLVNVFALAVPLFVRLIYDRVIPGMAITTLNTLTLGVLFVITFELFCRQLRIRFIDVAAKRADLLMSSQLFAKVMHVELGSVPAVAGAFARQVQDFESIREFLTSTTLTVLVEIPFAIIFLAVIGVMGGTILWVPLAVMILMVLLSVVVQPSLRKSIQEGERLATRKHGDLVESISGLESLRLAGAQGYFQKRWEQATGMMAACGLKTRTITGTISVVSVWLQQLATIGIVFYGVRSIHDAGMNMGALIAIMMLSGRAIGPFMQLSLLGARYWQAKTAYRTINKLMLSRDEVRQSSVCHPVEQLQGEIVFNQVSFIYPGSSIPAIKDISFTIKPGERIAVVGRSGSGKSTLARLLAALYQPEQGQILLDGINVMEIQPSTIRRRIGFLAQEPWLFNGSVMANIVMGADDRTDDGIMAVARKSGVTMFTGESLAGLEYPVGEGGRRISGGQRRSVALARAMIQSPDILVLDEPSAYMDSMMDARVQQILRELPDHMTVLVITHRSTLLSIVDRVLVLDHGRLVSDQPVER